MIIYAVVANWQEEFVGGADNILDSLWSTPELALKRLYFIESYYKNKLGKMYEKSTTNYEIEEVLIDSIPNFTLNCDPELNKAWLEQ